jgi:predicted ATP-dependent serine protease
MIVRDLYLTDSEKEYLNTRKSGYCNRTSFDFLKVHYGLRPGKLHALMGVTSGGKSTLVRSIVEDIYKNNNQLTRVLIWLSEESAEEYRHESDKLEINDTSKRSVQVISEQDFEKPNQLYFIETVKSERPDILILDNITTSSFYNYQTPLEQQAFAKRIKKITQDLDIATLIVCHTGAQVNMNHCRLININDISGTKALPNLIQHFYIMQSMIVPNGQKDYIFNTVRVLKNRGYDMPTDIFLLKYNQEKRKYENGKTANFKDFKEIFSKRNKL